MRMKTNKNASITGYFSHHIRGTKGVEATDEDIQANCDEASRVAHQIMRECPNIDLYVPADHDEFVCIAHRNGILDEKAILAVDCEIVHRCHFVLAYANFGGISHGMEVELDYARDHGIPSFIFTIWDADARESLLHFLHTFRTQGESNE